MSATFFHQIFTYDKFSKCPRHFFTKFSLMTNSPNVRDNFSLISELSQNAHNVRDIHYQIFTYDKFSKCPRQFFTKFSISGKPHILPIGRPKSSPGHLPKGTTGPGSHKSTCPSSPHISRQTLSALHEPSVRDRRQRHGRGTFLWLDHPP